MSALGVAALCTYSFTVWNTVLRRSEGPILVRKNYSALSGAEIGPRHCTPCQEDQVTVRLSNGLKFEACKKFANEFQAALEKVLKSGRKIDSVVAYRPSVSKGKVNSNGLRSEFSHHAFGVAIDLNENFNGLYEGCGTWNSACRLIKGGVYSPGHPKSIRDGDEFVKSMAQHGFKWGGTILGQQKDFMHFSLDGY